MMIDWRILFIPLVLFPHGRIASWILGLQGRSCLSEARRHNVISIPAKPPAF